MQNAERVDGVVAPVRVAHEIPVEQCRASMATVPQREPTTDVAIDVEDVAGQRKCDEVGLDIVVGHVRVGDFEVVLGDAEARPFGWRLDIDARRASKSSSTCVNASDAV